MTAYQKLKLLENRKNLLMNRDTDNGKVIKKINREMKKLECKSGE